MEEVMDNRKEDRRHTEYCNIATHCVYEKEIKDIPMKIDSGMEKMKAEMMLFLKPYIGMIEKVYQRLLIGNGTESIQTRVTLNTQAIEQIIKTQKEIKELLVAHAKDITDLKEDTAVNSDFSSNMKKVVYGMIASFLGVIGSIIYVLTKI
jgi:hypothetical protein